jgi:hypothetical protein
VNKGASSDERAVKFFNDVEANINAELISLQDQAYDLGYSAREAEIKALRGFLQALYDAVIQENRTGHGYASTEIMQSISDARAALGKGQ